jgi:DNA-directed RNA polymerase I subunit RPA43
VHLKHLRTHHTLRVGKLPFSVAEIVKIGVMTSSGALFSVEELQKLKEGSVTCVCVERRCVCLESPIRDLEIALFPQDREPFMSIIYGMLYSQQNNYIVSFNGFIMGHKNVKILAESATTINDDPVFHFDVIAGFYIFRPNVGCILLGTVITKGVDIIVCLVHKSFYVNILRPTEETDEEWLGMSVNIGDEVSFIVEVSEVLGNLQYIHGKLISSQYLMMEDEDDGSEPVMQPV